MLSEREETHSEPVKRSWVRVTPSFAVYVDKCGFYSMWKGSQ